MFELFVRGQAASEAALARQARQANRMLICDTDAFTTSLYHELYYGSCPPCILEEAERGTYDLYLLTYSDPPHVVDPQRMHGHRRDWMYEKCAEWIARRKARHVVIRAAGMNGSRQRVRRSTI